MATHPFPLNNAEGYRILTPLISHLLGFRGGQIIYVVAAGAVLLQSVFYIVARRRFGFSRILAVAATLSFALTLPVALALSATGYPDSITYALALCAVALAPSPMLSWTLVLLAMFNADRTLFMVPVVVGYQRVAGRSWREIMAPASVAAVVYGVFRAWIAMRTTTVLGLGFYVHSFGFPALQMKLYGTGVWAVFRFLWALPVMALAVAIPSKQWTRTLAIVGPIACAGLQCLIAWDTTRMYAFSFLMLLPALDALRERWGEQLVVLALVLLVAANVQVPQDYVAMGRLTVLNR